MTQKKRGRKPMKPSEKIKVCSVYLRDSDKKAIITRYGTLTNSIKQEVLPKLK